MTQRYLNSSERILDERGHANLSYVSDTPVTKELVEGILKITEITVKPGMGFLPHLHKGIDLITIPLEGKLERVNSTGESYVIERGTVNVLETGWGIQHYEYNKSCSTELKCVELEFRNAKLTKPRNRLYVTDPKPNTIKRLLNCKRDDEIGSYGYSVLSVNLEAGSSKRFIKESESHEVVFYIIDGLIRIGEHLLLSGDTFVCNSDIKCDVFCKTASHFIVAEIRAPRNKHFNN
ncbi:pirin family protein [Luteirhabdus pelagi]|uniref:pirin family protein n=1 Tax=Luteirhabdus pelagi TaxID=2792783 RepID=UPI001939E601|nr:pirin family protein [Luteirhabdus pelagi]